MVGRSSTNQPPTRTPAPSTGPSLSVSSSFVYWVTVVTQLVGFASSFFIAHHIAAPGGGLALVGFIQFNLLLASSVNTLGELRLGSAFVYFIARDAAKKRYTGTYFVARTAFVVFLGIALLAISPFLGLSSMTGGLTVPTASLFACLVVFMVLPVLWTPSMVYGQLFVGLGNSVRGQMPTLVESSVRTAALIVVALTLPTVGGVVNGYAIWGLTGGYVLGATASAVVSLPTVWKHFSMPRWVDLRHMLTYAWPLTGSMGLLFLVTNAMPLLTRAFYDVSAVADFNAANGFRVLLLALPTAVVVPLFPHLAGLHERKELDLLKDRVWRALRYTAIMVVPGAVLFVVYRVNLLLLLFSNAFILPLTGAGSAATPLALLALSAVPLALSQIIGTALNSIGLQRLEFYLTSAQIVVLFVGIFGFLRAGGYFASNGLSAIALAALLSSIVALALNAYFLASTMKLPFRWRPCWTIPLAAVAEFLVMSRLNALAPANSFFAVNRWYELGPIAVLALVVYVAVLIGVGELSRQDTRIFAASIGIGETWSRRLSWICWRESSDPPLVPNGGNGGPPPP